jgi:hypothetical protein
MTERTQRLAVLIDAENAQASVLDELLAEIAKLGTASVKRIYGDFTHPTLSGWRPRLLAHSIQPIQQFRNTVGKNASDSALIIDAMDLLHSKRFDGMCIVSSDSDFTRLASRIREEGVAVYGFGERKTPTSFVSACDRFIYTEILRKTPKAAVVPTAAVPDKPAGRRRRGKDSKPDAKDLPVAALRDAVEATADETGWAHLGQVGTLVGKRLPDFDTRNFGHRNFSSLMEAAGGFELQRRGEEGGRQTLYVRVGGGR